MGAEARTPEELETLFEDASLMADPDAVADLFEDGAVLVMGDGGPEARGREAIVGRVAAVWERNGTYLADPRRVVQARDVALVVSGATIAVVRRGADGVWRYAISLPLGDENYSGLAERRGWIEGHGTRKGGFPS